MLYSSTGFDWVSLLFSHSFLGFAIFLTIAIPVILWITRKRLSVWQKVLAAFVMGLLVIYFSFVIWLILSYGRARG